MQPMQSGARADYTETTIGRQPEPRGRRHADPSSA
ncbi:hypothetical protein BDSB_21175 [Burkholderia dolosa PC543]|nr:hypothetical protein BDSB_21175 [Burkholderia dolosa PC543]